MTVKSRLIINITGHVQGVFYRSSAKRKALELGVTGWIINNNDGTVTCVAEGDKDKLKELLNWCKQGPERAVIDDFQVIWSDFQNEFTDFSIKF